MAAWRGLRNLPVQTTAPTPWPEESVPEGCRRQACAGQDCPSSPGPSSRTAASRRSKNKKQQRVQIGLGPGARPTPTVHTCWLSALQASRGPTPAPGTFPGSGHPGSPLASSGPSAPGPE